jgi:CheY-like chemotaxis protein
LDVMMDSVLDGISASRKMSEDAATAKIPIIMVTSIASTSYADYFPTDEYLHVQAFMSKPVSPAVLVKQVNRLLPKK